MTTSDPVTTYFEAWRDKDVSREGAPPTPVANWSHVEDGLITRIRVTFDPRGMLGS